MPRSYASKHRYGQYDQNILNAAVEAVRAGDQTISSASRVFNVPRKTIFNRLKDTGRSVSKHGGVTVFTESQESEIVDRVRYLESRGFPLDIDTLLKSAYAFALTLRRRRELRGKIPDNWHENRKCSRDWWWSFKRRHPMLTLRKPEGLSVARANAFNSQRIDTFFTQLHELYEQMKISSFPQMIFNIDETGLSSVPNSQGKVIATKGARTVQSIQISERGTLSTIIPAISAAGDCLPPFVIMKGKSPSDDLINEAKDHGMHIASTKTGYIETEVFIEFLNHFEKHRTKIPGQNCILFLDGHSTHVSIEAIEFCRDHGIEMVCLPPHSSHRLQPLDTHFNKALKSLWCKAIEKFLRTTESTSLSREQFMKLLTSVWDEMKEKRGLIVDAFSYCGLHPLNRKAIREEEFSKSNVFKCVPMDASKASVETASETVSPAHSERPIKRSFPSPTKTSNKAHLKEHVAQVSNLLPKKKARLRVKLNWESCRKTEKQLLPQPSTSERSRRSTSPEKCICCVCNADFYSGNAKEDWLQCSACGNWSCETCFAVDKCYNCE